MDKNKEENQNPIPGIAKENKIKIVSIFYLFIIQNVYSTEQLISLIMFILIRGRGTIRQRLYCIKQPVNNR